VLAEVSIGGMFIAGVIPGLLLALGFVAMIMLLARFRPASSSPTSRRPRAPAAGPAGHTLSWARCWVKLVPIVLLVALVLGGLYTGFFTPTEAGGVGAFGALLIALARAASIRARCGRCCKQTGEVSVSILILLIAAGFYSRMLSIAGIPNAIADLVRDGGFGPYGFLLIYVVIVF
jgi:C4-dicarboxylate transporter, DctM subunit